MIPARKKTSGWKLPSVFPSAPRAGRRGGPEPSRVLGIALEGKPGEAGAVGIKEAPRRLGCQLGNLAVRVLLIELLALAEDGDYDMPSGVAILAGQAVEQRRGSLMAGGCSGMTSRSARAGSSGLAAWFEPAEARRGAPAASAAAPARRRRGSSSRASGPGKATAACARRRP